MEEKDAEKSENVENPPRHKKKTRVRKKQLYGCIRTQMEFYFSEAALSKDRFLSRLIAEDPLVPVDVFLTFNKIKALTDKASDVVKALAKSTLLQVSEDGTKVKRSVPLASYDPDPRTIYVESIPASADMKWLSDVFQEYGPVAYISLPRYHKTDRIKGFAFVEFENPADAEKCLAAFTALGCKLPTSIKPEELASCTETQDPNPKTDNSKTLEGHQEDSAAEEPGEPPAKKIKIDEQDKDSINVSKEEVAQLSDKESEIVMPMAVDESNVKKKRKKRDRRKPKNVEKDGAAKGLQILSKKEWKVLRNKYLTMQRKHMEELKQALRTRHAVPDNRNRIIPSAFTDSESHIKEQEPKPVAEIPFIEGVIVAAVLPEPCLDIKKLKQATKANVHVKFVDVKEGSTDVYIRMDDSAAAKQFASSHIFPEARVLEGEEEKLYWEELKRQQTRKSSSKRMMRGRDKLLKKAQEVAALPPVSQSGRHIRFDDRE